ncbi:unnamed protein product [Brachionus calyciflorus]|uniref:GOST seven transmembrane domain-containing protein n=1 Tax=Brachionus calyciflorus TaxID=104777 RepID=A0A814EU51_9BILA|nr:unnamed protein product [Brachionus calyciflorus]
MHPLKLLILSIFIISCQARIHQLKLNDDTRKQVTISTFGYLKDGLFQVDIKKFSLSPLIKLDAVRNSFAFLFEKNKNRGFSSFTASNSKSEDFCQLLEKNKIKSDENKNVNLVDKLFDQEDLDRDGLQKDLIKLSKKHAYSFVLFHLDLIEKKINVLRIGQDLKKLSINSEFSKNSNGLTTRPTQPEIKFLNQTSNSTQSSQDDIDSTINQNDFPIDYFRFNFSEKTSTLNFQIEINIKTINEEGLYQFSFYNCFQPDVFGKYSDVFRTSKKNKTKKISNDVLDMSITDYTGQYNQFNNNEEHYGFDMDLVLLARNQESFLSAGELPVPTLYLTWSIIYFLAAISWTYILRSSKGDVFKIHYLMLALVFVKALTLTFHAINMHYIAMNGTHEAIWAILYYITYVLRGLLLIISILLVGTGWTFIKYVLSENERRLFVIVVPLQILAITAYIFLEEREEGEAVYVTWRQLFFLLDLICCAAILFPIVWSIRHLEAATQTDGKMQINLKKLKIFKHFYIMVICYVYFTRIIGFLLKQVIPFRYEWFDELSTEVVTFTFFALTAVKFQPASNNPYLQLNQNDDGDEEIGDGDRFELTPPSQKLLADFDDDFNTDTVFDLQAQNKTDYVINNDSNSNLLSRKLQQNL